VRNKNWKWFWNDTLQQLAQQRQHSYRQWQAIPTSNPISKSLAWDNHIADRRQFQQSIKRHRALYWNQFCAKLKSSTANDTKCQERVNNFIKRRRRTAQPTTIYTSPHGPQAGANDMIQHLTEVFGGHDDQAMYPPPEARGIDGPTEAEMELFTPDNIATIIHKLPARKAPGSDHITAEMLKPIVDPLSTFLSRYLYCCWKWALFPTHWRTAQVVPIYKKGDPTLPSNYRPISLTSHFRKLFERLILPYLLTTVRPLDISQGGFRAHRGSLDQAFVLHHLIQQFKHQYHHYPTLVFLDIAAAYDSVDRSIIWRHLDHQQVPKRITRVLQSLFNHINVQVLLANYASSFTRPKKGVLQGSILSPLLYAIFIDTLPVLLRNTPIEKPILLRTVPIGSHSEVSLMQVRRRSTRDRRLDTDITLINATLYADDVAILGSPPAILQLLHAAEQHSNDNGYRWSPTKCRVIRAPAPSPLPSDTPLPPLFPDPPADAGTPFPFRLYNTDIPNTTSFSYLGIPFTYQGIDKSALITNNTNKATNVMRFLKKIGFNQYGVGLHEALTVYRIFVRPVFEYGLAIIDPNHIQQQRIHQCQQLCLAFTLNRSSTARSPTKMLEHLSILPTTQLRLHILQFKFLHRFIDLPPSTMLASVINTFLDHYTRNNEWKRFKRQNPLFQTFKSSNLSPAQIIQSAKATDHELRQASLISLRRTRPGQRSRDPILYIPATTKERHRLVKWRFHWLPPHPHTVCPCDDVSETSRSHYTTQCPRMESHILHLHHQIARYQLPPIPADLNIIDHILNLLPSSPTNMTSPSSHWRSTWPSLLDALHTIDQLTHPDAIFLDGPPDFEWLLNPSPTPPSSS
jgi:hypothetical protein